MSPCPRIRSCRFCGSPYVYLCEICSPRQTPPAPIDPRWDGRRGVYRAFLIAWGTLTGLLAVEMLLHWLFAS